MPGGVSSSLNPTSGSQNRTLAPSRRRDEGPWRDTCTHLVSQGAEEQEALARYIRARREQDEGVG